MKKYNTINIPSHTPEWYEFRTIGNKQHSGGTGASEIGVILGQSHYNPNQAELFHYKVGSMVREKLDSERMFHGRNMEHYIGSLWQCYDGTEDGYISNYTNYINEVKKLNYEDVLLMDIKDFNIAINKLTKANDYVIRKSLRHEGYIVHPDYPYLFCSLDFKSDQNGFPLMDLTRYNIGAGEIIGEFPIETKTIDKFAAKQFVYEVPDMYISQLQVQMLLTDSYYGELAVLIGGNHLKIEPIERNDYICNLILKKNTEFWEQRVLPARELWAKYQETKKEEYLGDLYSLEPEPDANPTYKEFLSDRHIEEIEKIKGDMETFYLTKNIIIYAEISKRIKLIDQELKNKLTKKFVDGKCGGIEFDGYGMIKYFLKAGNKNKELGLRGFKDKPSEEFIDGIIDNIKSEINN